MNTVTPQELLAAGVHLGHKKSKVHPRAKRFIYTFEGGVSIIDLFKTAETLKIAQEYANELGKQGKTILVVASKKNARETAKKLAEEYGIPYMTNKWVAGLLTNFAELRKNADAVLDLQNNKNSEEWKELVKHEQVRIEKKINRLGAIYHGVLEMKALPDALFVVDIRKEANSVNEARQLGIPTIAIVDTNGDPTTVEYPIPGNDDSISSVECLIKAVLEAYNNGKTAGTEKETQKVAKEKTTVTKATKKAAVKKVTTKAKAPAKAKKPAKTS
ncbi:MAG: 30S ribosomal protein S2 [Microgenomates bacterium OLB22]|nr:MAG: 30S ribosomal protein S2 [Microgenomates bacterium OLB22]